MTEKRKKIMGFIDETGVLADTNSQRFFALGLLKLANSALLYSELWKLKSKAESSLNKTTAMKFKRPFEFKFYNINNNNCEFYYKFLDLYFSHANLQFCCFIIDKENPKINVCLYDTWDYYIKYSITLIRNNLAEEEEMFLIADYLGKPNSSEKYWEDRMKTIPNIFNAIMIESHCSLYNQIVDILIGSIAYDYKLERQDHRYNLSKLEVCNYVKEKLGQKNLIGNFTVRKPNYFRVWEFNPEK